MVNSKFGDIQCLKFRPLVQSGRVLKNKKASPYGFLMIKTDYRYGFKQIF